VEGKILERRRKGARLLSRIALVGAATVVAVAFGSPAWANSTININPGNVPTTAAGAPTHVCSANQGGGPFPTQDVWVFVLPDVSSGDFVSVTATFGANGTITITTALNPGNFDNDSGAAKAWIITPAGWTLTAASAEITGTAAFFTLSHTCPASGTPTTGPPTTGPPTTGPPTTGPPTTPPGDGGTTPPGDGGTPSGGVSSGGGGSQSNGGLIWGLTALVVAAAGGGVLFLAWRRRNSA
jgi:hypothetical protein